MRRTTWEEVEQGTAFLLADLAAAVEAAWSLHLVAARPRDAGLPVTAHAAMATLFCTDTATRVSTDIVGLFGPAGYTRAYPVERYLREAKVPQIFEGTNQIQRLMISRRVCRAHRDTETSRTAVAGTP